MLFDLLMKVYERDTADNSSKLHILGVSVDDLDSTRIRSQVSFLSKDAITYAGTVRENIDPTGSFSDEEIIRVLSYLKAGDIIDNKEGGMTIKRSSSGANSRASNELKLDKPSTYRVKNTFFRQILTIFRKLQKILTPLEHL